MYITVEFLHDSSVIATCFDVCLGLSSAWNELSLATFKWSRECNKVT